MSKITGKQIIEEVEKRISNLKDADLSQTVGALNGVDMDTYNRGYIDALSQLKAFFETRV